MMTSGTQKSPEMMHFSDGKIDIHLPGKKPSGDFSASKVAKIYLQ